MNHSVTLLILICTCVLITDVNSSASTESVPPVITMTTNNGEVTFHHSDHQIWSKGRCDLCHHQGAGTLRCGKCHNGSSAKIEREVIHDMCHGCHEKNVTRLTPKACGDCHNN